MKKKIIVITGGAGFVGSNLINLFLRKTNFSLISIDNYISGSKKNHLINKRVKYIKSNTTEIYKVLNKYKKKINCIFHFGEFSRIFQSFSQINRCFDSNVLGTNAVINFCLENKIKLIYSATSATLGNNGEDKNLSPYAFTKAKNLELLENLKKWFKFKFEIIYFYNVYGPYQISKGKMATVIGIFEEKFINDQPLPVVKPGTQSRRFTHIDDTCEICYLAWKKKKNKHYVITNRNSYSILEVANMFKKQIKYLPQRRGERYASALTDMYLDNKVIKYFGKIQLKNYIKDFINKEKK
jgi:UDP-glucose 4-epimerase